MKKTITLFFLLLILSGLKSQNIAITDDNAYTADPSAMLDVKSLTKGMLAPRMTTIQRTSIVSPATGLLVFDTNENVFYYYTGSVWTNLSAGQFWTKNGNYVYLSNTDDNVGIGVTNPNQKLLVKADASNGIDESIFAVLNNNGDTVFAVYQEGVRIWVDDNGGTKANGNRGGFAVGGFNPTKAGFTNEYLRVTPDSVRVYINDDYVATKANGSRGGFAVGGYSPTKGTATDKYLFVQDDSTRIYTGDTTAGFGVENLEIGTSTSYMQITPGNYFIGHNSGEHITTGLYNSTFGYKADSALTTGSSNVSIGYEAGKNNKWGNYNVFIGNNSGLNNIAGDQNVFIGDKAGRLNNGTTGFPFPGGYSNVYIGNNAGELNPEGYENTYVGCRAGMNNLDGFFNTFVGTQAGQHFVSGWGNAFFGQGTGYSTNGDFNTYLGAGAGYHAGAGNDANNNTYVGFYAGSDNWTGSNNIYIGYYAGRSATGSDKLYIENSSDLINPLINGDFLTSRIAFHCEAVNYPLQVGTITTNGNGAFLTTGGVWTAGSSKSFKDRFVDLDPQEVLDKISQLELKGWYYKNTQEYHIGPFAEDFYNAFGTGVLDVKKDLGKYLSSTDVAGVSLFAVKELIDENKNLKQKIELMQKEIDEIKEILNQSAKR